MEERILERDTSDLKLINVTKDIRLWNSLKGLLMGIAEKGYTDEMSPTGDTFERAFGPKELFDLTRAADMIGKNMNTQISLIRGDDESEGDAIIPRSVRVIVYNSPGSEESKKLEEERVKSLPAPITVEGEVVDGTV